MANTMTNVLTEITIMTLYWMMPDVDPTCGHHGTLQKELYHTTPYVSTKRYFNGEKTLDGELTEVGDWDILYDKLPCDISTTPFTALVSEKFKTVANSLDLNVKYHRANVIVSGKPTNLAYYFPEQLDLVDFMDLSSTNTSVLSNLEPNYPGWIKSHSEFHTKVHFDKIGKRHWVKQKKAFGYAWIVSEYFKNEIMQHELTNFMFVEALAAENR